MRLLLPIVMLLLFAADARAATYSGAASDPEGDAPAAGVDIVAASWSFDDAAGTAGIVVTLKAPPDDANWGVINASFRTACEGGSEFATFRINTRTAGSGGASAGNAEDGRQPDGSFGPTYFSATNVKSDEGRTTTSEATHERLVGRRAGCVRIHISHNGTLDSVTIPVKEVAGEPTPPGTAPGEPAGPTNPNPGATARPEDVKLRSGRRLRFRSGKTGVGLDGVAQGMKIRVSLRTSKGLTLASTRYVAKSAVPPLVSLKLNRNGRRHKGKKAYLFVHTTLGSTFQRRYAVKLSRR